MFRIVKKLWEHSKETSIVLLIRKDDSGNIPLHLACAKGENEIVKKFLEAMKDEEVPDIASRLVAGMYYISQVQAPILA